MSMFRQLWLAILASTLMALTGSLLVSMLSARSYLESQLSIKNTDNATALALSLSQSKPDDVMIELVVASLFDSGHYELIKVTNPKGGVLAERMSAPVDLGAPTWFTKLLPIHAQSGQALISSGWTQLGTVTLLSHSRFAYDALWKSAYQMALALAAAGVVGCLLASLVLGRIRHPLRVVIEQANAITQRRFVTVALPKVPELKQLAIAMNATVGRLKAMFDEEAVRLEGVRKEANFDNLTGLANRSYFMGRLRQTIDSDEAGGGTLILLRLADLAGINRRLGRGATDDFLKAVAPVAQAFADQGRNGVAARLNGADFAILLPGERSPQVITQNLLQHLIQVAAPFVALEATVWIGYGKFVQGADVGALLARVDFALATAEAERGNGVREAQSDDAEELPRSSEQWAGMIQRALAQGWVRLISFPVVAVTGHLSHRECPLRLMFDEKSEWVPAGRFLPVAERLRLTPALDLAAVSLGLQQLQAQTELPGLAINQSASSVADASFRATLVETLSEYRGVTSRLWLEVAESGAFKHLNEFRTLCAELKKTGCRVGLEHFGHQFSQVGLLHDLGLDYLKVDSSFVRGIDTNAGNAAFLKGLSSIAHNIGLLVLAEGVTTQAEWDTVKSLGFDGATGPGVREPQAPEA